MPKEFTSPVAQLSSSPGYAGSLLRSDLPYNFDEGKHPQGNRCPRCMQPTLHVPIQALRGPIGWMVPRLYWASWAKRNPKAPERSMLGEISSSLPCSVSL